MTDKDQIFDLSMLGSRLMELSRIHSAISDLPFAPETVQAVERDVLTEMKKIATETLGSLGDGPEEPQPAHLEAPEQARSKNQQEPSQ